MNYLKYIKHFRLLIFSFIVINGNSQQTVIDSLKELIESTRADTVKIVLLERLGQAYREEKKLDSSIISFKQALVLNEKSNYSPQTQCWEMSTLNYLLYSTGNYAESLDYASRGLISSEQLKDTFQLGHVHLAFGHNYKALGEYRLALNHYFKAKQVFKQFYQAKGQPEDNTYTILCISEVYLKKNQPDSALLYARQAYELAMADSTIGPVRRKNSLVTNYILYSLRLFGDINFMQGYNEAALSYYRQYISGFMKYKENNRDLSFVFVNMAKVLHENNQNDSAIFYAKKALVNAREYDDQENIFSAASLLSDYHKKTDSKSALDYLTVAMYAKDSMISSDKLKHAQLLSFNEEIREKEKTAAEIKQAVKIKLIISISAILISIIAFLIWSRIRQLRLKYKMILEQKEAEQLKVKYEKKLLEMEARALRAQMNPHFIFNCMNSIKSLIQQGEEGKAVTYLTTFSKLIRTIFQNSDKREITLYDEVETCRLYTELESMRFGNRLSYAFEIDEKIDLASIMVPALILQPFIENAIWHGIMPRDEGGVLDIRITRTVDKIYCIIDDDGIGRETSRQNKFSGKPLTHQSKGIPLTQSRLEINNILNLRNASVEVIDKITNTGEGVGTRVILVFNED